MEIAIVTAPEAPMMFAMADNSVKLATISEKELVEVVERINELWWKVKYRDEIGYIRSNYLKSENFNDITTVSVNLPKDEAAALYRALKSSLIK